MNHDERFQQRWEFRRKEDEEDSSSLDSSNFHDPTDQKLALVLHENEMNNLSERDNLDTKNVVSKPTKAPKRKAKKKKNTAPTDKPKRKRKKDNLDDSKDMVIILEDLKTHAGSLIRELSVAREEMSQQLREVAAKESTPGLPPDKKRRRTQNRKAVQPRKGNDELNVKPQKRPRGPSRAGKKGSVAKRAVKGTAKPNKALVSAKTDEQLTVKSDDVSKFAQSEVQKGKGAMPSMRAPVVLCTDSNQVASTSFLGFKADERFGNFSCFGNKTHPSFLSHSSPQSSTVGIGFPSSPHRGFGISPNMSESSNFGGGNQALSAHEMHQKQG